MKNMENKKQENKRQHMEYINNLKAGDIIKFGSYPYEADGKEKPIEWIILEKYSDDTALLLSRYGLDAVRFDGSSSNWEKSEIRQWLNNEFYNKAFKETERINIIESSIECEKRGFFGNSTYTVNDKIFLLSKEEAKKYFNSDEERKCCPTPYAQTNKTETGIPVEVNYGGSCCWWLRSPGGDKTDAAIVDSVGDKLFAADVRYYGNVDSYGDVVDHDSGAVRMAFKINLKNL
jgi:hypothetical protein